MNEIRTLMEKFWICRDSDKETFYKVKRDIPNFQRFIREQLGWKLIHTEKLLKLEKRPAHAEAFMGISEFTDIRDYCILCVVLMYLEDAEEGRQFLLSELIDYVETQLKNYMPVDWTSFTQRKSLVRVLQYMERLQMLRVYEGKSESFSQEAGQEVLYENTGYSKYFTSSFTTDISGYESWKDFEKTDFEEFEENRGSRRINRVYRQLAVCPALYWDSTEDADALYLKANLEHCVGMAANMIGVKKNIIVVAAGPFQFAMINPVITKKSGAYQTEEGCLSLEGVRPCTRYQEIEVDYLDQNFKKQHGKYSGWTAQIIQHEIDHCNGIVI